jgi:Mrp family chromosome partitioning ATPase
MAEMGDSVVLVEADLHKGQRLLAGDPERGLSSVLAGTPLDLALIQLDTTSAETPEGRVLTVLPSGSAPPNPSELLESERMRGIIAELQSRFDVVIIDSPALGVVSDTLALVPEVDTVVVVSGLGTTTRDGARKFMKQLSIIGVEPAGVIANFTKVERGGYAYYQRGAVAPS